MYRGVYVFREGVWRETDERILKFRVLRKRKRRETKYEQDRNFMYPRSDQKVICFFKKKGNINIILRCLDENTMYCQYMTSFSMHGCNKVVQYTSKNLRSVINT